MPENSVSCGIRIFDKAVLFTYVWRRFGVVCGRKGTVGVFLLCFFVTRTQSIGGNRIFCAASDE